MSLTKQKPKNSLIHLHTSKNLTTQRFFLSKMLSKTFI